MGRVSDDQPDVAPELGTHHAVLRLPGRHSQGDLHHQRVESLNMSLRKVIKTRGSFPNEGAALKLLYLALEHIAKKWTMPIHHWREALNHFTILWPERMPALERVAS